MHLLHDRVAHPQEKHAQFNLSEFDTEYMVRLALGYLNTALEDMELSYLLEKRSNLWYLMQLWPTIIIRSDWIYLLI